MRKIWEYYFNTCRERDIHQSSYTKRTKHKKGSMAALSYIKFTDKIELILTWPFLHFGPKRRQTGRKMSMFKIPFFQLLYREKFHKDIVTSRMFELAYEHSNNNNKIKRCPSPVTLLMLLPRTKIFTPPLSPLH